VCAKRVKDKEPILEILVGIDGRHWKIISMLKGY